jgi:hypothetical protein
VEVWGRQMVEVRVELGERQISPPLPELFGRLKPAGGGMLSQQADWRNASNPLRQVEPEHNLSRSAPRRHSQNHQDFVSYAGLFRIGGFR